MKDKLIASSTVWYFWFLEKDSCIPLKVNNIGGLEDIIDHLSCLTIRITSILVYSHLINTALTPTSDCGKIF